MKKIRYALEALFLHVLLFIFKLLPVSVASDVGGWFGRVIGPRLAASRKAYRNLNDSIPGLTPERQKEIIAGMWENLGRIMAEYPHLDRLAQNHTHVHAQGEDVLEGLDNVLFFSAHTGNWEVMPLTMLLKLNHQTDITYRAPNNPWSDRLLLKARAGGARITAHSKSRSGGKSMIQALQGGKSLAILIDQKYNQGVSIPFFGRPAMTNPVFVQLAQKYEVPLVPFRVVRNSGADFTLHLYEPVPVFDVDGHPLPIEDVVQNAHTLLEGWITEYPEQWLWLHRRWD